MRWSEKQTFQFVKQYMKYDNLWNSKNEQYKVSNLRMESYKEIISQFHNITGIKMNIAELKIKIKSLRSTYMQEVAKIKRRSGPNRTYRSNLKWFPLWHKCFINTCRTDEGDDTYNYQQESTDDPSETWISPMDNTSDSSPVDPFVDDEDYTTVFKEEPTEAYTKQECNKKPKIRKRKYKQHNSSVEYLDKTYLGRKDGPNLRKEDEFDIYGKYIATQLRDMTLHIALRTQLEIQSIVSEARLSNMLDS